MLFAKIIKKVVRVKTKDKSFFTIPFVFSHLPLAKEKHKKLPRFLGEAIVLHSKNNLYYFFAINSCT